MANKVKKQQHVGESSEVYPRRAGKRKIKRFNGRLPAEGISYKPKQANRFKTKINDK